MQLQQAIAAASMAAGILSAAALETGQALAMAELRTVLAVFLGNFFFQLPEGVEREKFVEEEEVAWVTLQARHGVRLRVSSIMGMQKEEYGLSPEE